LPLDKLIQSTNPGAETVTAAKPTEQLNSTPGEATPAPRARESLFGREREAR
jgi:hypothetical protein